MDRALAFIAAVSLLTGCYASHRLPPEARDGGPTIDPTPDPDGGEADGGEPPELEPGTCRQGCARPSDCGDLALRTCMDGACYFVGCDSDADCSPTAGCVVERRQCRQRCASTADCAEVGSDNGEVACMGGLCRFLGCPSDSWCADYAARWDLEGRYVCTSRPAGALPRCWQACDRAADCAEGGGGHPRECREGVCRLMDCTSTEQCRSWRDEEWLCVPH